MPGLVFGLQDHSTAVGRLKKYGHGDHAARRSLLDLPDIDLPCPSSMILPDLGYAPRFLSFFLALAGFRFEGDSPLATHRQLTQGRWALKTIKMKKQPFSLLIFLISVQVSLGCSAVHKNPFLVQTWDSYKWGYKSLDGKVLIPPQFDAVYDFMDGLAWVKLDDKWGIIDTTGKFIVEPQFVYAENFSDGLALVLTEWNGKYGFIDQKGKFVIEPIFSSARSFSDGLAAVMVDGKWGYIDSHGQIVITPKYGDAGDFNDGLAPIKENDHWGYINTDGNFVITPQFDYAKSFSAGLAPVEVDDKWGYIDQKGNFAIQPKYSIAEVFSEGLAITTTGQSWESWDYIDHHGNIILSVTAIGLTPFHNGVAQFVRKDQRCYINKQGEQIYCEKYEFGPFE